MQGKEKHMIKKQNNIIKFLLFLVTAILLIINENKWFSVPVYIPVATFFLGLLWGWDIF